MASYDTIWSRLKFNAGNAFSSAVSSGYNWRLRNDKSTLVYKNNARYKSVAVHAAKQLAMSELAGELQKLLPRYKKQMEKKMREEVLKQQSGNYAQIIQNQKDQSEQWGQITTENSHVIIAKDKYGSPVKEALMVYYTDESAHTVTDVEYYEGGRTEKQTYDTKTVCHIDLAPSVSMNSTKNVVMTQVQGRDYTRKELVSGGDLQFSVKGNIVSDEMGVYPVDAVKKFIQIMEYNGILNVNFMMFDTLNVKQIIVKDYSLDTPTFKNIQPYSFNCVAIEADDEVKVQTDTIAVINKDIKLSPMSKWYNMILQNKIVQMNESIIENTANSAIITGAGLGLDKLITNI